MLLALFLALALDDPAHLVNAARYHVANKNAAIASLQTKAKSQTGKARKDTLDRAARIKADEEILFPTFDDSATVDQCGYLPEPRAEVYLVIDDKTLIIRVPTLRRRLEFICPVPTTRGAIEGRVFALSPGPYWTCDTRSYGAQSYLLLATLDPADLRDFLKKQK